MQSAQQRLDKMVDFYKTLHCENIDLPYYANADHENFQDYRDAVENEDGFNIEIIYYATAMKYLTENDNSLKISLELAADMGFELKNLNSETLASLLATENSREEFNQLESDIEDFFETLNEERDAEEEKEEKETPAP